MAPALQARQSTRRIIPNRASARHLRQQRCRIVPPDSSSAFTPRSIPCARPRSRPPVARRIRVAQRGAHRRGRGRSHHDCCAAVRRRKGIRESPSGEPLQRGTATAGNRHRRETATGPTVAERAAPGACFFFSLFFSAVSSSSYSPQSQLPTSPRGDAWRGFNVWAGGPRAPGAPDQSAGGLPGRKDPCRQCAARPSARAGGARSKCGRAPGAKRPLSSMCGAALGAN